MKKKLLKFLLVLTATVVISEQVSADCTRHIYNKSSAPWIIYFGDSSGSTQHGDVYFKGDSSSQACVNTQNGPCTILPNQTVAIVYTHTSDTATGNVSITDQHGTTKSWFYEGVDDECPYITHDGNTGSIALNDSADGDINAWGPNTW